MMSWMATWYCAASAVRSVLASTLTSTPLAGGITRARPGSTAVSSGRPLDHRSVLAVSPYWAAMFSRGSPVLTGYVVTDRRAGGARAAGPGLWGDPRPVGTAGGGVVVGRGGGVVQPAA